MLNASRECGAARNRVDRETERGEKLVLRSGELSVNAAVQRAAPSWW